MGYFDKTNLLISDGTTADQGDLNDFVNECYDAFTQVEQDIAGVADIISEYAQNDPGVPVVPGEYSSKHYAYLSQQWAIGTPVDNDLVATGDQSAKQEAIDAAASAAAAATSETNTGIDATATAADVVTTTGHVNTCNTQAGVATTKAGEATTAATNASNSETAAAASKALAEKWATENEDVEVESGKYSAYHWAQKSAASGAGNIQDTVYGADWNGVTTYAPSKNAVYDKIEALDTAHNAAFLAKTGSTGSAVLASGTTAQRDVSPVAGYLRHNTDRKVVEAYLGGAWNSISNPKVVSVDAATLNAESNTLYLIKTGSVATATTVNLPSTNLSNGDRIVLINQGYTWNGTNKVTVSSASTSINGGSLSQTLDDSYTSLELVYDSTANSWNVINAGSSAGSSQVVDMSCRNILYNPWFVLNERGDTSYYAVNGQKYTVDRWSIMGTSGANGLCYVSQVYPSGVSLDWTGMQFPKSILYISTGLISFGSSDYFVVQQRLPDEYLRLLSGKRVTFSFYASTPGTGDRDVSVEAVQSFGTGGSAEVNGIGSTRVTINYNSNKWKRYWVTMDIPSVDDKVINAGAYFSINLWIAAGADYNSRTGSLGVAQKALYISNPQLEIGDKPTAFCKFDPIVDQARCEQFYEVMSKTTTGMIGPLASFYNSGDLTDCVVGPFVCNTRKQNTPTVTVTGLYHRVNLSRYAITPTAAHVTENKYVALYGSSSYTASARGESYPIESIATLKIIFDSEL